MRDHLKELDSALILQTMVSLAKTLDDAIVQLKHPKEKRTETDVIDDLLRDLMRFREKRKGHVNRSLSSRQTKKQKILLKMVSVICRGHLFMQHPASYGNSLVRGNLDDADAVGSCSNE